MLRAFLLAALVTAGTASVTRDHAEREALPRNDVPQPDAAEFTAQYWIDEALRGINQRGAETNRRGAAKNVVMFLGDGMSVPTLTAARALLGQRQGQPGEEAQLSFESFPSVGLSKTYCLNAQIADSACTATAYLCGVKANRGTIGLNGAVQRYDCEASTDPSTHLDSIAAWALEDGRDAGVVTTTRITHASPAGAYARVANRHYESDADVIADGHDPARCPDIATQLISMSPGNQFKVILGGGRREFRPTTYVDEEGSTGTRTDGRNLIEEWQNYKATLGTSYNYVWNRDQLMEVFDNPPDYLLGLFKSNHMEYHMLANATTEPTLAELTEVAIRSLSRNEKGPHQQLFSGLYEQSQLPHLMAFAGCFGPGAHACNNAVATQISSLSIALFIFLTLKQLLT